jgi:subtilisin family serine protease
VASSSSGGIFLSYRREDTAPYARSLQLQLSQRFPDVQVFIDLDSIEAGLDFAQVITEAVDSCAVLVALIGRQWVTLADEEGNRRLDNPDDYVRFEVHTALEREMRVIPVLVDGAKPLRRQQLPAELAKLARLNALELSYGRYQYDTDRLLDLIQRVLAEVPGGGTVRRSPSTAGADAPIVTRSDSGRPGGNAPSGALQKSPGPVRSAQASAAPIPADVEHVVTPQLSYGADEATRAKLGYSVEDRLGVLVELGVSAGLSSDDIREQFRNVFHTAFEHEREQPPEPVPISAHYMRCVLTRDEITRLAAQDAAALGRPAPTGRTIYRIWPDYIVRAHIDRSVTTIKADAAARTYGASGEGIVWAVIDSGIDYTHPHFAGGTLTDSTVSRMHRDFTGPLTADGKVTNDPAAALNDYFGHGTHVAGIIAGAAPTGRGKILIAANDPSSDDLPSWVNRTVEGGRTLSGMAPKAHLVSLKVLDDSGYGLSSSVIAALAQIRQFNEDGRRLIIHGVNMSLGYNWLPDEFATGQSPLCRELDQLVRTGVVAVVSAGNSGAGGTLTMGSSAAQGELSTIEDPGNAIHAITVGSTHRSQPLAYGVTNTSSKGPTLDGRLKPDLVAPGERITSAATGVLGARIAPLGGTGPGVARYAEESGTSLAAAHVSGAVAAFLSVRDDYIGRPDEVKQLFMSNATSLGRLEFFQGAGLVDLMRVLSNV